MRRAFLAVAVSAVMLLTASAAFAVQSTVTIRYNTATENFHGRVRSSNEECTANRVVRVFRKTANGPSLQGRVRTNANGRWRFHAMDAQGRYFAVAPRYDAMGDAVCQKDRTPTIDVM